MNINKRKCKQCQEEKPLTTEYFYQRKDGKDGKILYRWKCKECESKRMKKWRKDNEEYLKEYEQNRDKEKRKEQGKKSYYKNHKKTLERKKISYKKNKEKIIKKTNSYRKNNPEKAKEWRKRQGRKWREVTSNKISSNISKSIRNCLKSGKNGQKWESLVGYNLPELQKHLEKQFDDKMNWENYGKYWHIDHIIPQSMFKFDSYEDEEFRLCWSLNNLQPKEAKANISKGGRFIG